MKEIEELITKIIRREIGNMLAICSDTVILKKYQDFYKEDIEEVNEK